MPYEQVTKIKARDGSLHDTLEAAQAHDARRDRERRREQTVERLRGLLWQYVPFFEDLPVDYSAHGRPSQVAIAEAVFDQLNSICYIIKEGMGE